MSLRTRTTCLLVLAALLLAGCGEGDVDRARDEVRDRVEDVRTEVRRQSERLRERVRAVLADIEKAIPEAPTTRPVGRSQGRTEPTEIGRFMTGVIEDVDQYWTKTLTESGLPAPEVRYHWVAPGRRAFTGCGALADDDAAFYCPSDDTIYVAQQFASDLYRGVLRGLPGERAGHRAAGDFAVAYVIAHEYAHNVQTELGIFSRARRATARPTELQADCLAGAWANSVYEQGLLEPGDLEEAVATAQAVGDFDTANPQHHGTPRERRDALLTGYETGDPSVCRRYVPEV
jgi:predicted metalloprotease